MLVSLNYTNIQIYLEVYMLLHMQIAIVYLDAFLGCIRYPYYRLSIGR